MNLARGGWLAVNPEGSHSGEDACGWEKTHRRDRLQKSKVKVHLKPSVREPCVKQITSGSPQLEILTKARKASFAHIHHACRTPALGQPGSVQ